MRQVLGSRLTHWLRPSCFWRSMMAETLAAQAPQREGLHFGLLTRPHPEEPPQAASRRTRPTFNPIEKGSRFICLLCFSAFIASTPAFAQTPRAPAPQRPQAAPATPAQPSEATVPYEPQLLRLAEILGSLAFLRDLCGAGDADKWRAQMAALLSAEGATEARKERMAGAFNKGFRGFEQTYRTCTPNAQLVITRYVDEGERIAHDIASRYGGG